MTFKQACEVLQIKPSADETEVKRAYRKLARRHHPDANQSDQAAAQAKFREVCEAYELVNRALLRIAESAPAPMEREPAPTVPPRTGPVAGFPGEREMRQVPARGEDIHGDLRLDLTELFSGSHTDIAFPDIEGCESCGATGADPASGLIVCPACGGDDPGCGWCEGSGEVAAEPCSACRGAGVQPTERTVSVEVPAALDDGCELRLTGEGQWGIEQRGDIVLTVRCELPPGARRDGLDLYMDMPVGLLEAVLGGHAALALPDGGQRTLQIPAGTSSGKRFRLRAHGLPGADSDRGDLYAVAMIAVPKALSERQRRLYEQLVAEEAREG